MVIGNIINQEGKCKGGGLSDFECQYVPFLYLINILTEYKTHVSPNLSSVI